MDRDELKTRLLSLVEEETGQPLAPPDERQNLKDGLGLDSVDLLGLVMRVEGHFGIRIENQELWPLRTFGDLLDLLQARLTTATAGAGGERP
jgi:acyl carrier protein